MKHQEVPRTGDVCEVSGIDLPGGRRVSVMPLFPSSHRRTLEAVRSSSYSRLVFKRLNKICYKPRVLAEVAVMPESTSIGLFLIKSKLSRKHVVIATAN